MLTSKISTKGQIKLPREVRQALHLKPGGRVIFLVEKDRVLLRSLGTARRLAGSLNRYASTGRPLSRIRGVVKEEVARAAAQKG